MCEVKIQIIISRFISIAFSILLLAKMIYQAEYIHHDKYDVVCNNSTKPFEETTPNDAKWLGFEKIPVNKTLLYLLRTYFAYLVIVTLHAIIDFRQERVRTMKRLPLKRPSVIFPNITREDAEKDLPGLVKYLLNYGFYRFGLELSLIVLVAVVAYRQDMLAILYVIWLSVFIFLDRRKTAIFWPAFQCFTAIFLSLQYLLLLGIPPSLCIDYPWKSIPFAKRLEVWAMLPGSQVANKVGKAVIDFILLIFITRQTRVFSLEKRIDKENIEFPGGSNKSVLYDIENLGLISFNNPTPDFIANVRNWLDIIKNAVLSGFFWITLAVVFLTGTNIISIFSVGYLVGSFVFLWQGSDFYLRPINKILKWWYILLYYNVIIIFCKTILQIGVCLYLNELATNACSAVHLFGVTCKGSVIKFPSLQSCPEIKDHSGLIWDAICFAFLLLQRRIFNSHYFCHIINDTKASTILASRGAILIEDLRQKQIQHKAKHEREILRKIKTKMERIRATQQKMLRPLEKQSHYDAIRAGDYYMFDDPDEKIELNLMDEETDFLEDQGKITATELKMTRRKAAIEEKEKLEDDLDSPDKTVLSGASTFAAPPKPKESEGPPLLARLFETLMVSLAIRLNRLSRNYRYVMKILAEEKKTLKESKGFGQGIRAGTGRKWTPFKFLRKEENKNTLSTETKLNNDTNDNQNYSSSDDCEIDTDIKTITIDNDDDTIDHTNRTEQGSTFSLKLGHTDSFDLDEDFTTRDHHIIIEVLIAVWYAILSNTDIICYFVVFVNQVASASILSLPLPIMTFLWGTLAIPRPTKTFWVTLIAYTQCVVLIKCIFQFKTIWIQNVILPNQPLSAAKIIGIEPKDNYAAYDLLLLLVLFFHRFVLKSQGLWKSLEGDALIQSGSYVLRDDLPDDDESGSLQEMKQTAVVTRGKGMLVVAKKEKDDTTDVSDINLEIENKVEEPGRYVPEVVKITSAKYFSSIHEFFKHLVNKARLPSDVYALMFICDFTNFFVLLFGFTAFGSQQGDEGVQTYLTENKVPIPFLIMLLVQFILIIIDRALYLRKALIYKIIFHFFSVFGIHIWMFFVVPAVTERNFNSLIPPIIFYIIKCIYLLLSSYQIRCGYPKRILGNFLTKGYSLVNMISFKLYKLTPFLYELRTFLDWVCTDTTMSLWEWLKMEDIFSEIYFIKCGRELEKTFPIMRGEKRAMISKILLGGTFILVCVVIVWAPLALFALSNAVGEPNIPTEVSIALHIGSYEPLYSMSVKDNIHVFTNKDYTKLEGTYIENKGALTFITGYDESDVAGIVFNTNSPSLWNISPPDKERLLQELLLNNTLIWRLYYSITRTPPNKESSGTIRSEVSFEMSYTSPGRENMIAMLQGKGISETIVPNIFPKFLKIKNTGGLSTVPQLMDGENEYISLILKISMGGLEGKQIWWEAKEDCSDKFYNKTLKLLPLTQCGQNLVIYTFNDKKFPSTFSFLTAGGIIGMYTTFVIVASRFVRGFVSDSSMRIMFEDLPYVDRVLQLCLDIYLVREAMEFALEEDLFAKLLFLYRSPETMIKWTRPKNENTDEEDETESVRSRASVRRLQE